MVSWRSTEAKAVRAERRAQTRWSRDARRAAQGTYALVVDEPPPVNMTPALPGRPPADLPDAVPPYVCRPRAWCDDCRRPYGHAHGFPDLLIPNWAWVAIMGRRGGLLCPSCIVQRLYECGLDGVPSWWVSGPLCLDPRVTIDLAQPPPEKWSHYADWCTEEAGYDPERVPS